MSLHLRSIRIAAVSVLGLALAGCLVVGSDDPRDSRSEWDGWEYDTRRGWHRSVPAESPRRSRSLKKASPLAEAPSRSARSSSATEPAAAPSRPAIARRVGPAKSGKPAKPAKPTVPTVPTVPSRSALSDSGEPAAKNTKKTLNPVKEIAAKERQVNALERKLKIARLEVVEQRQGAELEQRKLRVALEIARARFEAFEDMEMPNRLEQSAVDLESSRNRYQDAVDELAQLEMMYKDSELEDRTAEIVLKRGRRQLDIARRRLELQKRSRDLLESHELPLKKRELEQKVEDGELALQSARRKARLAEVRKAVAVADLQDQLQALMDDIAELREKATAKQAAVKKGSL